MNVKQTVLEIARSRSKFRTIEVVNYLKGQVSRAWVSHIINKLVAEGSLVKSGSTAKAMYSLPEKSKNLGKSIKKIFLRKGLKEHEVLDDINKTPFLQDLEDNIKSIFDYSFSEMLNNAIEHSLAKRIEIKVGINNEHLWFEVRDNGIGVFRNVMKKRKLSNEFESMQDLLKGRITTLPHAHSGEGIFFTSKVGDLVILSSFGYSLRVDNTLPDIFFEQESSGKGTRVSFSISLKSKRHLTDIFSQYETDHNDPEFDKTEIQVRLYKIGTIYVSRSQARRVLSGLEKFKHIILNFDRVPTVGQAFCDEIFRVFHSNYPEIKITSVNMNEAVKYMIDRTRRGNFE